MAVSVFAESFIAKMMRVAVLIKTEKSIIVLLNSPEMQYNGVIMNSHVGWVKACTRSVMFHIKPKPFVKL